MESKRLLLRPFVMSDAEALYELAKDPDVGIHAGWPVHTSVENSEEILEKILIKNGQFAIILKESGNLIGAIALSSDPKRENEEVKMLGYWIGKSYWGNGYVTEAAETLLEYGFDKQGYDLISVYHYGYNKRSEAVIKKLGFQYEGYQRNATQRFDGKILDDVLYSMSKEEYKQSKN